MNIRPLAAVASVALLCACNSNQGNNSGTTSSSNSAGTSTVGGTAATTTGTTGAGGGGTRPVDPQLAQELQQAVQMLKGQLPMRQQTEGGEVRITNIEARGGELVYTMEVPADLDQAKFAKFREELPKKACENASARQMFQRGGTYTYLLRDPGGEEFTTSVTNC